MLHADPVCSALPSLRVISRVPPPALLLSFSFDVWHLLLSRFLYIYIMLTCLQIRYQRRPSDAALRDRGPDGAALDPTVLSNPDLVRRSNPAVSVDGICALRRRWREKEEGKEKRRRKKIIMIKGEITQLWCNLKYGSLLPYSLYSRAQKSVRNCLKTIFTHFC